MCQVSPTKGPGRVLPGTSTPRADAFISSEPILCRGHQLPCLSDGLTSDHLIRWLPGPRPIPLPGTLAGGQAVGVAGLGVGGFVGRRDNGQPAPCQASHPQAWAGLPEAACRSGLLGLLRLTRYSRRGSHKHRMRLAGLSALSSPTRGKSGEVIKQTLWPGETMGGPKFSCEPRQGAGFTMGLFVQGGKDQEAEQCFSLAQATPTNSAPRTPECAGGGLWLWEGCWASRSQDRWALGG